MNTRYPRSKLQADGLSLPLVLLLTLAAAVGTAATYPLQPAIASVAHDMNASEATIGVCLGFGPFGYMLGLGLLVPLVDRLNPRRVLLTMFLVIAAALALSSLVESSWQLAGLMVIIGAGSAVGAGLSALVGRLALPHRRATTLGIVTAGISAGILGGRAIGGWLSDLLSWRGMLDILAVVALVLAIALGVTVPPTSANASGSYLATLKSLPGLLRHPVLRWAAVRGAAWFLAFSGLWAGIAVTLSRPPFSFPAERIGWYALAGLLGVLSTQISGRLTDQFGANTVLIGGLGLALVALIVLALFLANTAVTLIALALFDAGTFAAQVANQSKVLSIDPGAPARYNSVYMLIFFLGGSLGAALVAPAVTHLGWTPTALTLAAAVAISLITVLLPRAARAEVDLGGVSRGG